MDSYRITLKETASPFERQLSERVIEQPDRQSALDAARIEFSPGFNDSTWVEGDQPELYCAISDDGKTQLCVELVEDLYQIILFDKLGNGHTDDPALGENPPRTYEQCERDRDALLAGASGRKFVSEDFEIIDVEP